MPIVDRGDRGSCGPIRLLYWIEHEYEYEHETKFKKLVSPPYPPF